MLTVVITKKKIHILLEIFSTIASLSKYRGCRIGLLKGNWFVNIMGGGGGMGGYCQMWELDRENCLSCNYLGEEILLGQLP